ncbi:MAG: type II secretion system protein [Patescibacteria group bacterium]|jgi:prepilin-type N-terminal cleavage/methylation domain-containing protein
MRKNQGITLIELMVAVLIIALIATIGLVAFRSAQAKSHDAKRAYDASQYVKALLMYAQENDGNYPPDSGYLGRGEAVDSQLKKYFPALPKDPLDKGGTGANDYYYYYVKDNLCNGLTFPTVSVENMETAKAEFHNNSCGDGSNEGNADKADYLIIIR